VSVSVVPAPDRRVGAASAGQVLLTLQLTSPSGDLEFDGLTLEASGTGDDRGIARVRVVADSNGNGVVDAGEATVAQGTYAVDDGQLTLTPPEPFPLPAGQTDLLVVYDL
jgi:hypothetical protein